MDGLNSPRNVTRLLYMLFISNVLLILERHSAYFDPSYGFDKPASVDLRLARRRMRVISVTCPARCGDAGMRGLMVAPFWPGGYSESLHAY